MKKDKSLPSVIKNPRKSLISGIIQENKNSLQQNVNYLHQSVNASLNTTSNKTIVRNYSSSNMIENQCQYLNSNNSIKADANKFIQGNLESAHLNNLNKYIPTKISQRINFENKQNDNAPGNINLEARNKPKIRTSFLSQNVQTRFSSQNKQLSNNGVNKNQLTEYHLKQKLIQHESQIDKNQRIISTLIQQFKLIKQKLTLEEQLIKQQKKKIQKYQNQQKNFNIEMKEIRTLLQRKNKQIQNLKEKIINSTKKQNQQKILTELKSQNQELKNKLKYFIQSQEYLKIQMERFKGISQNKQNQIKQLTQKTLFLQKQKNTLNQQKIQLNKKLLISSQQYELLKNKYEKLQNQQKSSKSAEQIIKRKLQQIQELNASLKDFKQRFTKIQSDLYASNKLIQTKIKLIDSLQKQNQKLKISVKQYQKILQQNNDLKVFKQQISQKIKNFESQIKQSNNLKQKLKQIKSQFKNFQAQQNNLKKTLSCSLCKKIIKQAVTIIPCGHNFCFQNCYQPPVDKKIKTSFKDTSKTDDCKICKHKKQFVYRNQLLDQFIDGYNTLNKVQKFLKEVI